MGWSSITRSSRSHLRHLPRLATDRSRWGSTNTERWSWPQRSDAPVDAAGIQRDLCGWRWAESRRSVKDQTSLPNRSLRSNRDGLFY